MFISIYESKYLGYSALYRRMSIPNLTGKTSASYWQQSFWKATCHTQVSCKRLIQIRNVELLEDFSEIYFCGRSDFTVPLTLAVSGPPSGFLLCSGSCSMSDECLASVFDKPSCLPDCEFEPLAGLEVDGYKNELLELVSMRCIYLVIRIIFVLELALFVAIIALNFLFVPSLCVWRRFPCITSCAVLSQALEFIPGTLPPPSLMNSPSSDVSGVPLAPPLLSDFSLSFPSDVFSLSSLLPFSSV